MNRHKYSGFKSERREQMLVEALENNLTSQDLFDKYQTELSGYDIKTHAELHSALYPKCTQLTNELNMYIENREKIRNMSSESKAKIDHVMSRFKKMGFNYESRTSTYDNLRKSSNARQESLEDLLMAE